MNTISTDQLLHQMRMMTASARGDQISQTPQTSGFGDFLNRAINSVADTEENSPDLKARFESGDPKVSLSEAMVAGQKTEASFQAMLQVRNRLVKAYQDIMNMPV